jgi:MFS superfamily sulfate permease-like transporter
MLAIQFEQVVRIGKLCSRKDSPQMFKSLLKQFDPWSLVVVVLTFVLFFIALFIKGLTHDLLLEAGVFLVSMKLIIMSHKQGVHTENMERRLDEIYAAVRRSDAAGPVSRP